MVLQFDMRMDRVDISVKWNQEEGRSPLIRNIIVANMLQAL